MNPQEKAEILREAFNAFANQDVEDLSKYISEYVTWHEPSGSRIGGSYSGRNDVVERLFATIPNDWEEFTFDIHDVLYSEQHAMVLANWHGKSKHTGKAYNDRLILMAHIDNDGLVEDVWASWTAADMAKRYE